MNRRIIIRVVIFLVVIVVGLVLLSGLFIPKFYLEDEWATTSTFREFYEEKDKDDVIFIGSSRGAAAFDPIQLEDETGLKGYNICCEQQNLSTSYYWLKEALRSQSPKTVVLDTNYLYLNRENNSNLFSEGCVRKAIDNMHWNLPKMEIVRYICSVDDEQSIIDYVFPILRFHDRWQELSKKDVVYSPSGRKGYNPIDYNKTADQEYHTYDATQSNESLTMDEEMEAYLNRIKKLCDDNNIRLVLVSCVSNEENANRYTATNRWCQDNNVGFVDFNLDDTYKAVGYNFYDDNSSGNHAGITGAKKMTSYMGNILLNV